MNMFSRFMNDESGATAIEYGLIAALIGVTLITVLGNVGSTLKGTFQSIDDGLKGTKEGG
jgi:pilus assembly protein Flp/PilA